VVGHFSDTLRAAVLDLLSYGSVECSVAGSGVLGMISERNFGWARARYGSGSDVTRGRGTQGGEPLHEFQRLQVLPIRLPSEFVLAATTQAGICVVGPRYPYQQLIWNQYGGLTTTYCDPWG
jgi:hypothetical protein